MTMTLYHCKGSRSLRALWTLEEMGLDYELVSMAFPPRYAHEGYKEMNPIGTVPFFQDGEVEMTESSGIALYLAETYGPTPLAVGRHEPDYGAFLNWLYRSDATLTFPLTLVFRYTALEPEERRQPQVVEDYKAWYLARMRTVEAALETRDYLCADRFTIADICVSFAIGFAEVLGVEDVFTPNVKAYWDRLRARDAFQKVSEM